MNTEMFVCKEYDTRQPDNRTKSLPLRGKVPLGSQELVPPPSGESDKKEAKKKKLCGNCGIRGHIYAECTGPIISIGIIAFRKSKKDTILDIFKSYLSNNVEEDRYNKLKILLIQRKDTMGYIDFLRGKHPERLNVFLDEMIPEEIERLRNNDFDTLWDELWNDHSSKYYKNEKRKCKAAFEALDMEKLLYNHKSLWYHQEFGIPKGRKNLNESFRDCAIREFEEETGYSRNHYNIIDTGTIEEVFTGSNGVDYKHIYYLAIVNEHAPQPSIDLNNRFQSNEVKNIGFFTKKESCSLIRNYDVEKRKVIFKCFDMYYQFKKRKKGQQGQPDKVRVPFGNSPDNRDNRTKSAFPSATQVRVPFGNSSPRCLRQLKKKPFF
jgi:ADP-ribose pyrophosphatase YjhB (NUDIX family)